MDDLHDRFDEWLVAGAEGEPPRDLAVHASGCDACLRSLAAIDSLQAIDIGATLPPLGMAAPTGREGLARTLRYAVGAVAVVLLGTSVAIAASGLLRPAQLGSARPTPSPAEGVLAGVPTAPPASQPDSEQPTASPGDSGKPKQSPTESPVAVATPAPQVLPHSTPTPPPLGTPRPTPAPTQSPAPTSAPTATPIVTPPPPTPTPSPSIVVPTPTPTLEPTPTATLAPAQCSDGVDNDGDLLTDFPSDPGCSDALDDDEVDP